MMRRLLVHFHVYYHDQVDYFIGKLANISGCDWSLYVTMSEYDEETEKKIRQLKADACFIPVENVGYDVWPFIKIVNTVNLDAYDYILKLHTKNINEETYYRVNSRLINGMMWRDELVDSLLKNRCHFMKLLDKLDHRPDVGLICSDQLYIKAVSSLPEDNMELDNELGRIGFLPPKDRHYCAGTMFIARSCIYKFLQKVHISPSMFDVKSFTGANSSLAHVYERILSMAAGIYSYRISTVVTDLGVSFYVRYKNKVQPVLEKVISLQREDGIKYMILFGVKMELSSERKSI